MYLNRTECVTDIVITFDCSLFPSEMEIFLASKHCLIVLVIVIGLSGLQFRE